MPAYSNGNSGPLDEVFYWAPGLLDSGDLEAGANVIAALAEPGAADYTTTLTLAAPTDERVAVTRIAVRLVANITAWGGGGTTLNYTIKRGGVTIKTGVLEAAAGVGSKAATIEVTAGLLTGDSLLTVFYWVDVGTCTIDQCQLYLAIGATSSSLVEILTIAHVGAIAILATSARAGGAGNVQLAIRESNSGALAYASGSAASTSSAVTPNALVRNPVIRIGHSVATEIGYLSAVYIQFRSDVR